MYETSDAIEDYKNGDLLRNIDFDAILVIVFNLKFADNLHDLYDLTSKYKCSFTK